MNLINSRLTFILLLIFTIGLFFSSARIITHNNFPVIDQKHDSYYNHHYRLKEVIKFQKQNINSEDVCENISKKIIDRHHLRWVFEEVRINFIDSFSDLLGKKSGLSIGFSIMLSFLIISSFFISLLTVENNLFEYIKKYKKRYIILLLVFFLIISFYSFRFVSELRYSFFEMFFLSVALFSSIKKKRFLFLIIVILATLNRESGILISSIWFIINGIQIKNKKINLSYKETIYGFIFIIISILSLIIVNYEIFSCSLTLEFLSYKDPNTLPVFNKNIVRNLNIIFSNFFVIILLLYFFFNDFEKQFKLIMIILFYNIVFLFFTPADHAVLRIMFAPIFLIYVFQYLDKFNDDLIVK